MSKYLIVSVGIITLIVGLYSFYRFISEPKEDSYTDVETPENSEVKEVENEILEGGYTKYNDADFDISFNYNSADNGYNLTTTSQTQQNLVKTITLVLKSDLNEKTPTPTEGPVSIDISIYKNPQNKSGTEWIKDNPAESLFNQMLGEISSTKVDNKDAVIYSADGLYVSQNIVVSNDRYIYKLSNTSIDEHSRTSLDFGPLVESFDFE